MNFPKTNRKFKTRPVNETQYFVAKLTVPDMGGVFNVMNLHVYHYAGNNPVKYVDPDGRTINLSSNVTAGNGLKQSQTDASIVKRTAGLFLIGLGLVLDYGSPLITGLIYSSGGTTVAAAPAINAGSKALGKTLELVVQLYILVRLLMIRTVITKEIVIGRKLEVLINVIDNKLNLLQKNTKYINIPLEILLRT